MARTSDPARLHQEGVEAFGAGRLEEAADLMRSAMREDEWLLLAHGAVLGVVGGLLHAAAFA